ncbi:hypothetical protein L7F22_018459, partial [Adiantum nelumboides]|nr:hypothetical protein [Adiantum nelumboides]
MENASLFYENSNLNLQSSAPSSLTLTQRKNTHHLHVDVLQEYAPLQIRRREPFLSQWEKELRRTNKEHHLDLWTDGSIYPKDHTTNAPPPFANITNLLHFTGDGKDGLLGYTKHLEMRGLNAERETIQGLEKKITSLQEKDTMLGSRKRKRDLCNVENMKIGNGGLKKQIQALRSLLHPNSNGAGCNAEVHYSRLVPKEVVEEIITLKKICKLKGRLLTSFMNENQLEQMEVQAILDESGISQMGYRTLFKALAKKSQNKLQRGSLLRKPSHVKATRWHVNEEVFEKLGSPFHIEATFLGKDSRKLLQPVPIQDMRTMNILNIPPLHPCARQTEPTRANLNNKSTRSRVKRNSKDGQANEGHEQVRVIQETETVMEEPIMQENKQNMEDVEHVPVSEAPVPVREDVVPAMKDPTQERQGEGSTSQRPSNMEPLFDEAMILAEINEENEEELQVVIRRTREEAERAEESEQARLNAITQRYNQTQEEVQDMQDTLNQYFEDVAKVEEWATGRRQQQERMEASQFQEAW